MGETAAILSEWLDREDVVYAAADEQRGMAVAGALAAMAPGSEILFCPGSDALPGDAAPASPANVGRRVAALRRLRLLQADDARPRVALVTTGEALAHAYASPTAYEAAPPQVKVGAPLGLSELFEQLDATGYVSDERVDEPGEAALRGQVLDVYPADAQMPCRIEVADGTAVSIRSYDPATQLTIEELAARELGRVAEPVSQGEAVALIDHLPGAALAIEPAAEDRRARFLLLAADAEKRRPDRANRRVVKDAEWKGAMANRALVQLAQAGDPPPRFVEAKAPLRAFVKAARAATDDGRRVALLGSARDLRFLRGRIATALKQDPTEAVGWAAIRSAPPGSILTLEAPVERGFTTQDVFAVAAADLLGSRAQQHQDDAGPVDLALFGFGDIRIGDVVVHEDHGIGIVAGLEAMPGEGGDVPGDAIVLRYAGESSRLVPVAEADRIWRYGGDGDAVTLDKLDGSSWQKRRQSVDAAIAETARGMTALAQARADLSAPVLAPDPGAYERFVAGFPFAETRDQARAIEAVRSDLASGKPMDRLVVGDVGFGKTEVALRAAALAALAGFQVAITAPTTVLARQHLETFRARFEDAGITVEGLSRLSTPAEKKRVKAGLADGSVRIVVGTGAVAGKGVTYKNLALTIIDEEQRFGAADKARLRELGAGHVLTLSATPIPRTLQSALVGIQQLSVIATPPARRQPIRTSVGAFDEQVVRAALLREASRGGQSFVVVPRIEDMATLTTLLARLVPELDCLQAHGKLPAAEIDETMVRFGTGDGDVLLATNIIEAGLDVPRANTMVIWRADRFGLSQLHQLRGRVGRGSRRGQVLLLTEPDREIAPRTLKRLRTLEAFDRLGAGFAISAQDLDMRGAGDLLGETQAGHMKLIGIDLYQHLLESALRTARGEAVERWQPELHLGITGGLPESWIPDPELRVSLYARLARITEPGALDSFEAELEDRFGAVPDEAATLLATARIRIAARALDIRRIDAGPAAIALTPGRGFATTFAGLEKKGDRLILAERIDDAPARLARVSALLDELDE
ncbi:DEAD/DEAH box helicase [Sphingomonas turrisvirgatae]|uniref:Transcription-repair-coupling factor n=1 Tax=Sphingomonas turrisvirgatae TaxID=1888892 RepID=A0A1E3M0J7_9SPHN|nr:DEAD/DEAH box helicase [Sphingomonas turrisvirgatae]